MSVNINEYKVLLNLLQFPPVEGSRDAHQAWKENVCLLGFYGRSPDETGNPFLVELCKPGYVTKTCADLAKREYLLKIKALP